MKLINAVFCVMMLLTLLCLFQFAINIIRDGLEGELVIAIGIILLAILMFIFIIACWLEK